MLISIKLFTLRHLGFDALIMNFQFITIVSKL